MNLEPEHQGVMAILRRGIVVGLIGVSLFGCDNGHSEASQQHEPASMKDTPAKNEHSGKKLTEVAGRATMQDTLALLEEGVEVMPLPLLPVLKETLQ